VPDLTAPLVSLVTEGVGAYGVLAVFLLMILESACIPVPSEALMLYGGFLAARGEAGIVAIIVAGVAGNIIGSWIAYYVGRRLGRDWLLHPRLRWLHITPRRLDLADGWFQRHGDKAVLIARCLPIIRTFISLPAGMAKMPALRFTLLTAIGCIPWVTALALGGRAVGSQWEDLQHYLHYFDYAVVLAILAGAGWLLWRRRSRKRDGHVGRHLPNDPEQSTT
jgi:membrane protein DedA with SNARE-associated domain